MADNNFNYRKKSSSEAELIAFDHFIMIRFHMESLTSTIKELRQRNFSPQSIVNMRRAFLDVRMVIEELMLLSVSAHQEAGEAITVSLRTEYRADKKMSRLRALNAQFFPDAIDVVPSDDPNTDGQFVRVSEEYLTEEEAKSYYNECGSKLHASWKKSSAETYTKDIEFLERFVDITSRLLVTFEIDISGQGYMMLGHLNLGEPKAPSLFFAQS